MIEELFDIEQASAGNSRIHNLDARIKIILCFAIIIAIVGVPYSTIVYSVALVFFITFIIFWGLSRLSPCIYFNRLILALPFGILICGFQIFFKNRYYTDYHPIIELPLNITIYSESLQFASILLVKFLVCYSFIVLLSSTTKMQDLLEAAGRLKIPPELILALGMMIRYLFVFGRMFRKIQDSMDTRIFNAFDRRLPYKYRITNLGYIMGSVFLRSLEQGERTYTSMLCRGYGKDSYIYIRSKPLNSSEISFLIIGLIFIASITTYLWYFFQ